MTTVSSRKQKGRLAQQKVAKKLLEAFPELSERDVVSTSMGASGVDVKLSSAAFKLFPYAIEVKCQEIHSAFITHWQQTTSNTAKDELPLLVITANRKPLLAVLKYEDLLRLHKNDTRN